MFINRNNINSKYISCLDRCKIRNSFLIFVAFKVFKYSKFLMILCNRAVTGQADYIVDYK